MPRSARPVDLPLDPTTGPEGSVPERLAAQIRALVAEGTLRPGDPLPSSRALAERLGVSRGSVVGAYLQLSAEGYLAAVRGSGTVVDPALALLPRHPRAGAPVASPTSDRSRAAPAPIDLRPGASRGLISLTSPAWRRAWRDAVASAHGVHAEPLGSRALREVLAERLRRVRAVRASAEHVAVTAGTRDGLILLLTALQQRHGRPLTV
ncbi:GntR family transcriptional regulator, partial [Brachybacterium nesterenkovii]|uniref:GntR family transcriptional regulator n=1 Tax=Brachybacterium nesterenkovii TaxID=47847 RepID=UPI00321A559F